jgi:hypothetical protein
MTNRLILVAGSGRSGTSLFSGIMKGMGCHVPQPEVQADDTNPKGFGEPQWVVDFHSRLLRKANVHASDARPAAWSHTAQAGMSRPVENDLRAWLAQEYDHGTHVIIKDPRLLWFTGLWETVGISIEAQVRYVTVLRHPLEVVKSKQTYYGEHMLPSNRAAAWINTMVHLERATRDSTRTFVKYDDLLDDWVVEIDRVCRTLDLDVIERVNAPMIRDINRLVDPSLRRSSTADWSSLGVHRPVADMCEETWDLLERLRKGSPQEATSIVAELDDLRDRYADFYDVSEAVSQSSVFAERRLRRNQPRRPGRPAGAAGNAGQQATTFAARATRKARRELGNLKRRVRAKVASLRSR